MCCKIRSEIEDLGKGTIGASTVENFFTNAKRILSNQYLKVDIASWVETRGYDGKEDYEN